MCGCLAPSFQCYVRLLLGGMPAILTDVGVTLSTGSHLSHLCSLLKLSVGMSCHFLGTHVWLLVA